jgi:hypothetical protein
MQFNYAQVLSGHAPYHKLSREMAMNEIIEGKRPKKPKLAARRGLTKQLWEILEQSWLEDPNQRPDLGVILSTLNDTVPSWKRRKSMRTLVASVCAHLHLR